MFRKQPVGNRFLDKKWKDIQLAKHYTKMRTIRPAIDVDSPMEYTHLKTKAKKE
jgi:hypothetical protein